MNKEKEIEEMAKVLFESGVALDATDFAFGVDGDDHFTRLAIKLVNAGYGNVKQAVKEFVDRLKETAIDISKDVGTEYSVLQTQTLLEQIDDLITELYGADE